MMLDPPYILTHPLLRSIMMRRAELKEQAESLPQGSAERKTSGEAHLAPESSTGFRKRTKETRNKERMFLRDSGKKIGERHSVRKRMIERRRGRQRRIHD